LNCFAVPDDPDAMPCRSATAPSKPTGSKVSRLPVRSTTEQIQSADSGVSVVGREEDVRSLTGSERTLVEG
jgi:hypothetical protein